MSTTKAGTTNAITSIFVYGTLKRGQVREARWPCVPKQVVPALVFGQLYDLGPYPALQPGTDRVLGERWEFAIEDLPTTLRVLDAIEGYAQQENDLYVRQVCRCTDLHGGEHPAFTYVLAQTHLLQGRKPIRPDAAGLCYWPA